ncbi:MAG: acyl-CoA dehydrogenase [Desulfobacterales bacterium]|jgi:alkylation response protein AidB-like acyl-CoA dehydrogenase|nr:acyl-CoA dehydrogenase [Desulfobacterales bacterium]
MAQVIADRRDIDFVLHEQFQVSEMSKHECFADFNKKTVDMIVTEARGLAVKELLPTLKIGDEIGVKFDKGVVTTPDEFKRAWKLLTEGEWLAPARTPEWGGQGMPETLAMATRELLSGGNMALILCAALTHGAAHLVELFGSDEQKNTYLKNMYTGKWSGTMLLTEAEAGSDLGSLTASAVKNDDGTYSITGNKIFISSGEQDLTENIIHPVLARIEGAPAGSRGISLFLVPKYHVNPDGSLGERNDVWCTGIEEKMGIHGSPTCTMTMGAKGQCIGTLLGKENKGLAHMFVMMNEERLMCGWQSLGNTSSSYLHSLDFARTRVQSPKPGSNGPVTIINHADVRRMLLTMKMYVEGMRSLLYFVANCEDRKTLAQSAEEKERYQDLVEILIPVAKGYVSDRAVEMCNMGVQVFGGYGYTSDFPVEQLLRDVRICGIYEGTNGIQALDLMGRKISMKDGQLFTTLSDRIKETLTEAKAVAATSALATQVEAALDKLAEVVSHIKNVVAAGEVDKANAYAANFLVATGDVVTGWLLVWRALLAAKGLEGNAKSKDVSFYEGQLKSAEFFVESVLPVTHGQMTAIMNGKGVAVDISDDAFGGK